MKPWIALYVKDLKEYRFLSLFLVVAIVALNAYVHWEVDLSLLKVGGDNIVKIRTALPALPLLLSVFVLPFMLAHSFSSEWKANTHYLMFSLPVRKFQISFCKYLAVLSIGLVLFAVSAAGVHLMFFRVSNYLLIGTPNAPNVAMGNLWLFALQMYLSVALLLMGIVSGMEGLKFTFKRFRGGVTVGVFALSCYLYGRLVKPAVKALDSLEGYKFLIASGEGVAKYAEMPLPWIAYTVGFGLICWIIGLILFEKYVEI